MQLQYQYYYFKKALSPEICEKIIEMGNARIEEERSKGYSTAGFTNGDGQKTAKPSAAPQGEFTKKELKDQGINPIETYVRDSDVTWLNDKWLYDTIHPYVSEANWKAGWNFQWDYAESFQFTTYEPGGFYSWHKDGGSDHLAAYKRYIYGVTPVPLKSDGRLPEKYVTDPNMVGKIRKLSVTVNLSPAGSYDGGNLKFDFGPHTDGEQFYEAIEAREQGSIIIFPSFLDHTVTPITRGKRYSLVLWNLGDPFK
jgi:PKHD-type hydroxylase